MSAQSVAATEKKKNVLAAFLCRQRRVSLNHRGSTNTSCLLLKLLRGLFAGVSTSARLPRMSLRLGRVSPPGFKHTVGCCVGCSSTTPPTPSCRRTHKHTHGDARSHESAEGSELYVTPSVRRRVPGRYSIPQVSSVNVQEPLWASAST